MFRKKTIIIFSALVILLLPSFAFAEPLSATDAQSQLSETVGKTGVTETNIETVGGKVLKAALALVGMVFFIIIFYGGFRWLLARGNEEDITKAKNTVIGAIIGLMIVLGAYAITNFVTSRMITGGGGGGDASGGVPDAKEGDPTGCCLDRWETEGGYFGVGQSGWTGTILTDAQCKVLINIKDYPTQRIESNKDGQWSKGDLYTGNKDDKDYEQKKAEHKKSEEDICWIMAKTRDENSKWEQSDRNVDWGLF